MNLDVEGIRRRMRGNVGERELEFPVRSAQTGRFPLPPATGTTLHGTRGRLGRLVDVIARRLRR